jgi:RNA polymerase sigma-70 factor, ECF subfamily
MTNSMFVPTGMQPINLGTSTPAIKGGRLAKPEQLSDEELMRELQCGPVLDRSEACLGEIFRRYQAPMKTWCLRFSRNREEAVDLAQDVFLKAFVHLHSYRGESKVSTWLYAIARNHCLAFLRQQRRMPIHPDGGGRGTLEDANAMKAFETVETEELLRWIRQAMSTTLDPLETQVVNLHYMQGLPLEAITRSLELTNATGAKAYLLRARRKLVWTLRKRRTQNGRRD